MTHPIRHRTSRNFCKVISAYLRRSVFYNRELFRNIILDIFILDMIICSLISVDMSISEYGDSRTKCDTHNHVFHVHQVGNCFGLQEIHTHFFKAGKEHPALHSNHAVHTVGFDHLVSMFNANGKQITLTIWVILFDILCQLYAHTRAAHIGRIGDDHIVFLCQRLRHLHQRE